MFYTGFADEAAKSLVGQIAATKQLGWKFIEMRQVDGINFHDLPEADFERCCETLANAGIEVNCFGSAVANWSWDPLKEEDFQATKAQLERSLVRMKKLNCKLIRGMSFKAQLDRPAFDPEIEEAVFRKISIFVKMCEDSGVIYGHENCNNYAGMSWKHTLKLLERIQSPALKLIFDTGNPVKFFDRSHGDELVDYQNSWVFYRHVREFIYYVHIKDAMYAADGNGPYTFPGEGDGNVKAIVTDLLKNGYDGGFSMEPHMVRVFHDPKPNDDSVNDNYVEYGRRFEHLVNDIKANLAK